MTEDAPALAPRAAGAARPVRLRRPGHGAGDAATGRDGGADSGTFRVWSEHSWGLPLGGGTHESWRSLSDRWGEAQSSSFSACIRRPIAFPAQPITDVTLSQATAVIPLARTHTQYGTPLACTSHGFRSWPYSILGYGYLTTCDRNGNEYWTLSGWTSS